jgi:hypothetical protein
LVTSHGYKQNAQPFGTANIRIGVVDEEVKSNIHLASEKPLILCANVLNNETFNDDLQLKNLINQKLLEISESKNGSQIFFLRSETPNSNKINILYDILGDEIICQVSLVKEGLTLYREEIKGTNSDLQDLIIRIIDNVLKNVR